ncbi:hypothetical protein T02_10290 [Trichinella nativa]|uniref:Uncharacterized protein n=1 Tax=Trichinella nativa TaxID=6335 RepID=A0A0V1LF04_9BILA|nr:hypothetical protein T02_10290 [Trichinella nativa]
MIVAKSCCFTCQSISALAANCQGFLKLVYDSSRQMSKSRMQFIIGSVFLITFHFFYCSYRGISQKIGQDTSKDMEGIQKDSQMPINSHDMKLNTSYPGDENESELIIII